jgi:predicted membrane channel-forming protein YqfA (hemolysin III family)
MQPSIRKPVGILAIVLGLILYGGLVGALAPRLATLPQWLQAVVYLVLGVAWLLPLKPLLVWMNR